MTHALQPLPDSVLLRHLVRFDSTSRNSNRPIADFICNYLDHPDVRITHHPAADGDKVNLVISLGPEAGDDRQGLVLSGHMDVVPADEPEWTADPFDLVDNGDALVGRGSCDMKGFVALAINAMARRAGRGSLRHPLALVLTFDEELGCLGARHFVETFEDAASLPRQAIIGEPTSLDVVRLHKGHCKMRLEVRGRSAHSGYPHLGYNAIEPMGRAIVALGELRRHWQTALCPNAEHFPEVPFVALNLARLDAGVAINIIPERAVLELGFRVLPGMQTDDLVQEVERVVADALEGDSYTLEELNRSPPMLLSEDHGLYRHLCQVMQQEGTVSASYATDAGWLQHGGFECLLWGPGTIEVAHRPDESIPKAELARASELLDQTVDHLCGAGAS